METLEALRQRIATVEQLDSIVGTMKALAQVNIRQSERAVHAVRLYRRTVELSLGGVLDTGPKRVERPALAEVEAGVDAIVDPAALSGSGRGMHVEGLIVFGSDHGLCGRFNADVLALAAELVEAARATGPGATTQVRSLAVGLRIERGLEDIGAPPEAVLQVPGSAERIAATVQQMLQYLDQWRTDGIARVRVVHNRLAGPARFETTSQLLLPLDLRRIAAGAGPWPGRSRPMHTIASAALLAAIVRQYFFVLLFGACAESFASENSARLSAMQAAQKMLDEKRDELQADHRRRRQERITAEMLDVVAGFEAGQE